MYKALTMVQKGLWQHAANDMNASANRTGRHMMSPSNAFSAINSARLTAQMGVVSEPQLPLVGPPAFPPMTLVATQNGSAFALNIVCYTSLMFQICAQATAPSPAGKTSYSPSDFKPIGLIGGITSSRNIADLYTAKYGVPEVGSAITVRLYAVSEAGVRGSDLILTTVYQLAAAEGAGNGEQGLADEGVLDGEDTLHLAA